MPERRIGTVEPKLKIEVKGR